MTLSLSRERKSNDRSSNGSKRLCGDIVITLLSRPRPTPAPIKTVCSGLRPLHLRWDDYQQKERTSLGNLSLTMACGPYDRFEALRSGIVRRKESISLIWPYNHRRKYSLRWLKKGPSISPKCRPRCISRSRLDRNGIFRLSRYRSSPCACSATDIYL